MGDDVMSELARNSQGAIHPLDDVTWNALTGNQRRFALGNERVIRFPAAVAPFAAMVDDSMASFDALRGLIRTEGPSALTTRSEVCVPAGFSVLRHAELIQMIWSSEPSSTSNWEHIQLAESNVAEMLALVAATQPGPFGPRTIELGDYLGVRHEGKLVAMAGERFKLDGFTEISAVCVDPTFRGRGHAIGLMKLLITAIRGRGETPFLHVLASNKSAIAIYRKLGFVERLKLHLTVLGEEGA
jgi:predicted GNAT family acetyltransferase